MIPTKRDQRVAFQRYTAVTDIMGGMAQSWDTIFSRWCEVKPLRGNERDMAQQTESPRNYRIVMPRDSETAALTTKDRIVWAGKTGNIRFIADAGTQPLEVSMDVEFGVAI